VRDVGIERTTRSLVHREVVFDGPTAGISRGRLTMIPAAVGLDRAGSKRQDEDGGLAGLAELLHAWLLSPKQRADLRGAGIADIEPDDLRREPLDEASLAKVRVFGSDRESVRL
jgi:hypothetical protein